VQDTNDHIRHKHYEIIFAKSSEERFLMGLQMMEDLREIVLNSIRIEKPGITETELKIEFIKRYYKDQFDEKQMADITGWFRSKSQMP
jgi:hypothetical protein